MINGLLPISVLSANQWLTVLPFRLRVIPAMSAITAMVERTGGSLTF
jgi:hypothetical protein